MEAFNHLEDEDFADDITLLSHSHKDMQEKTRCVETTARILGIRWEHRVTKKEISERTGIRPIVEEVKKRRWRWLGHVLRMSKSRHPLIALTWNPQGARKKGRSRGTWMRSVESERVESGKTWNELNWLVQDRCECRKFVGALCSQKDYG
ncbi:endonuclease-reverse transcriptase [Elysia marginata]|uniref:Endonuclease-reverse transcriptase n=1 Tax=Elysia marginata TaxID=1093978 RepID=A0AAV4G2Z1_9GAST|nr:endonuclease-reverse transcriptase [Elysia marginata]